MAETTSAQISDHPTYLQHPENEKMVLRRLALSTIGDLTLMDRGSRRWNEELRNLSTVIDEIMTNPCPQDNIKLRPQQCWLIKDTTEAYIAKIIGFIGDEVVIRKWGVFLQKQRKLGNTH